MRTFFRSILSVALIITLLCCCAVSNADGADQMYLGGCDRNSPAFKLFSEAHPDIEMKTESNIYLSTNDVINAFITGEMKFDTFVMISRSFDVQKLMQKGYCADLQSSAYLTEETSAMYEPIQRLIAYNDSMYAAPFYCYVGYYGYSEEAWTEADLSTEDVPTSFVGLLDFLDAWVDRIKNIPEENISVSNTFEPEYYGPQSYISYLVDLLMDNYIMQCNYANKPLRFDTPIFKNLLERCQQIGADLYQYEPPTKGDYALFDELQGMRDLAHLVPLRMTEEQPILIKASLYMVFINASSQHKALATEYLEHCVRSIEPEIGVYLYKDAEPIEDPEYVSTLQNLADDIARLKLKLSDDANTDQEDRRFIQDQIDEKTIRLENMSLSEDRYLVSPNDLMLYRKYGENLYFQAPSIFDPATEDGQNVKQLRDRFSNGGLSVDQFIKHLDELAWMLETEAGE